MSSVDVYQIEPAFTDDRGGIYDLIEEEVGHTGLITSTKGAVRANHYHKQSTQYTYLISGKMELKTQPVDKSEEVRIDIMEPGCMAVIPPNVIHAVTALEDSVFIDSTTLSRSGSGYEDDTVRTDPL